MYAIRSYYAEYETCAVFGTMIMNANLDAIAHINSLCNRLGLDTITCGATVAFIMECFEKCRGKRRRSPTCTRSSESRGSSVV